MEYLKLADRNWPLLRRAMGGHTTVYRATHGLIGHRFPGAPPMLLLDHVGAKSGIKRTSPLVYGRDGENLVLVASKGGYPKHPPGFTTSSPTRTRGCRSARRCATSTRA